MPHTTLDTWEEEFDDLHTTNFCCGCYEGDLDGRYQGAHKEIKDFISTLLITQREEIRREIEEKRRQERTLRVGIVEWNSYKDKGYNQAIDDILSLPSLKIK